jgi:hypothetical protein
LKRDLYYVRISFFTWLYLLVLGHRHDVQLMLLFMTSERNKGFFALDFDDVVSYLAPAAIYDSITNMPVYIFLMIYTSLWTL